jgi:serine/threonine-protein kinase
VSDVVSSRPPSSSATGPGTVTPAAALDGDALVDVLAEERILDQERLRVVLGVGAALWLATALAYLPVSLALEPRPLWHFLVPHGLGWASLLAALAHVRRRPGTMRLGLALSLGFLVPTLTGAVVSTFYRGIVSPFAHGTLVVIAAYAVAAPMPWRRGLPWSLALALSWPLGVLALAALDPALAAQLEDPRLRADFQETAMALVVGALLASASQHAQWTIRREVLAQRTRHDYRVLEKLGAGGMGEVFRAYHPGLGREVALKVLSQRGDAQLEARFVREVRAMAELAHPGIVRVYDCGATEDGRLFYTMERLEGRTLAQLVHARGPLEPARAAYLIREAARALAVAHARGLVHRDVKPENLFVADVGAQTDVMKVLDFGIAKSLAADAGLTADGALVGSPRYMALEQALGEKVDVRADVYALGGALHFALTGAAPVAEPTIFAVVAAHAADLLVPPSALVSTVPAALDAIVLRCLHRDPAERFADAGALADALGATGLPDAHRPHRDRADDAAPGGVDREGATRVRPMAGRPLDATPPARVEGPTRA